MKSPPCLWAHCLDSLCAIMTVPDCATRETRRLGDLGRPFRTPFRICQEPIDLYSCHALKKRSRSPRDNNFFTDYRVIKFKITADLDSENRNTVLWKKITAKSHEKSLAEGFLKQNYCHACHTLRFAVLFPLPSCCVRQFTQCTPSVRWKYNSSTV